MSHSNTHSLVKTLQVTCYRGEAWVFLAQLEYIYSQLYYTLNSLLFHWSDKSRPKSGILIHHGLNSSSDMVARASAWCLEVGIVGVVWGILPSIWNGAGMEEPVICWKYDWCGKLDSNCGCTGSEDGTSGSIETSGTSCWEADSNGKGSGCPWKSSMSSKSGCWLSECVLRGSVESTSDTWLSLTPIIVSMSQLFVMSCGGSSRSFEPRPGLQGTFLSDLV